MFIYLILKKIYGYLINYFIKSIYIYYLYIFNIYQLININIFKTIYLKFYFIHILIVL